MKSTLRRLGTAVAAATLALTLAACSSDEPATDAAAAAETPAAEESAEPAPLPDPEHGDTLTADQAQTLPANLVALELGDGVLVAVDGSQPFPEAVVSYIQSITPVTPPAQVSLDPEDIDFTELDHLRSELERISEATGRRAATAINVGIHDNVTGELLGDGWLPQLHSELVELSMTEQAAGRYDTVSFHTAPEGAVAQLENNISKLEDPSVWEVVPPLP